MIFIDFRSIINTSSREDDEFDANAPGASDIEAYMENFNTSMENDIEDSTQSIQNEADIEYVFPANNEQGHDGSGEFILRRINEVIERNEQMNVDGYDDSDEDSNEADNTVIVISSDDENEEDRNDNFTYRRMMGVFSERPTPIDNLQSFSNNLTASLISRTISTAAASFPPFTTTTTTATTTSITSSTLSTATTTTTTRSPFQRCCICLIDIIREGISLHDNIHTIHVHCLMDFLANSQIIWLQTSFRFDCPLCREPVFGTVMMIS